MSGPSLTLVCGLGATGCSVLRHLQARGEPVRAWDSRKAPPGRAEIEAEYPGLDLQCGELDWADLLADCARLVVSPGLGAQHPLLQHAREQGLPILGDIDLFMAACDQPVIAVTGSNGKSTVVTALAEMARACGIPAVAGGNLGPPALDLLASNSQLYVLELSSFQLELSGELPLAAAAVLNLSPDHLDRHGDLASYAAAKQHIFAAAEVAIRNTDDAVVMAMSGGQKSLSFGCAPEADFRVANGQIWQGHAPLCATASLRLVGRHNHLNAAAALCFAKALGWDMAAALRGLGEFRGLEHRCEWVATQDGVTWINDSKGTNVGAMQAAIEGLDGPLIVLAGGQAKGGDFSPLRAALLEKSRRVILFGQDAISIRAQLGSELNVELVENLDQAVRRAATVAESGDSVLLSPGCASFDQFSGFEARGEYFRRLVAGVGA